MSNSWMISDISHLFETKKGAFVIVEAINTKATCSPRAELKPWWNKRKWMKILNESEPVRKNLWKMRVFLSSHWSVCRLTRGCRLQVSRVPCVSVYRNRLCCLVPEAPAPGQEVVWHVTSCEITTWCFNALVFVRIKHETWSLLIDKCGRMLLLAPPLPVSRPCAKPSGCWQEVWQH